MPMYEFTCRACGAEYEELCTATEAAAGKVACPACGARKSERKLSTFASKDGERRRRRRLRPRQPRRVRLSPLATGTRASGRPVGALSHSADLGAVLRNRGASHATSSAHRQITNPSPRPVPTKVSGAMADWALESHCCGTLDRNRRWKIRPNTTPRTRLPTSVRMRPTRTFCMGKHLRMAERNDAAHPTSPSHVCL